MADQQDELFNKLYEKLFDKLYEKLSTDLTEKMTKLMVAHTQAASSIIYDKLTDDIAMAQNDQNNQQLQLATQYTRELVAEVSNEISDHVYDRIVGDINRDIVPEVSKMIEWTRYQLQDGNEVVDSYRRAVERQARDVLLLTDGKNDNSIISPEVRVFFTDDD
jgi:RNA processing factor Prp31